jgi:hypothetical protein
MGKYTFLQDDVFSIFASAEWQAENINTYPENFLALNSGNTFIRVSVIPSGSGINPNSTSGILMIDLFFPAGNGPKVGYQLADKLDQYLVGKSLNTVEANTTQFYKSTLATRGLDAANSSLFRMSYTIPFNFFGAF